MVIKEENDGMVTLRGRRPDDWIIAPWWPCSATALRKVARDRASKKWVDEACDFADAEFASKFDEV